MISYEVGGGDDCVAAVHEYRGLAYVSKPILQVQESWCLFTCVTCDLVRL